MKKTKRQGNTDNVAENNKLIAEFMGGRNFEKNGCYEKFVPSQINNPETDKGYVTDYLEWAKYHTSWDWLMPVAKKISKLDSKNDLNGFVPFCGSIYCYLDKGIDLLYSVCIRHIKTYNDNK